MDPGEFIRRCKAIGAAFRSSPRYIAGHVVNVDAGEDGGDDLEVSMFFPDINTEETFRFAVAEIDGGYRFTPIPEADDE
jgi:hypothetical protein